MKTKIIAISTAALLGAAGAVLAGNDKLSICHNGSTYKSEVEPEVPISFVITIAGKQHAKAVDKHVENHGDSETYTEGLETIQECELLDDGETVECDDVIPCEAVVI